MAVNRGNKFFSAEAAANFFGADLIRTEDCFLWIVSQLHPNGAACPECSAKITDDRQKKFYRFEQIRCPECRKKFTAATGTALSGSKLDPEEIYLLAVLSHLGVSAHRIAGVLKCHVDTITSWQSHFKARQELASA